MMINQVIKFLVTWKWKKERFKFIFWVVDENTDICITTQKSYNGRHRFSSREELYNKNKVIRMNDAKLAVNTIAELQNEITTQREVICNLNAMNDELQTKLNKIEQIINEWNDDIQASQKDLWMYLADIKEILENE